MKNLIIVILALFPSIMFGQIGFELKKTETEDISKLDSIVLVKGSSQLTIFLQTDQKIENKGGTYIFHKGKSGKNIPVKLKVEGVDSKNSTISCSGCSVRNEGSKYSISSSTSNEFKILVSVKNADGASLAGESFTFTVVL